VAGREHIDDRGALRELVDEVAPAAEREGGDEEGGEEVGRAGQGCCP
jgi:hypothetical protein